MADAPKIRIVTLGCAKNEVDSEEIAGVLDQGGRRRFVARLGPEVSAAYPKALRHEVRFPPARPGYGMVGSGVFVVNAPFGTATEAARLSRLFASI